MQPALYYCVWGEIMQHRLTRLETKDEADAAALRRDKRYREFAAYLEIPDSDIRVFVQDYFNSLEGQHDNRTFVHHFFGLRQQGCIKFELICGILRCTFSGANRLKKKVTEDMRRFKEQP